MRRSKSETARAVDRAAIASRHDYLLRRMRRLVRQPNPRVVVVSRMLVFQSKLLLLNTAERTYHETQDPDDLKRVEAIRQGVHHAESELRRADARGQSARASTYWLAVYESLIDQAQASLSKLNGIYGALPGPVRFEVATDVQMLEDLVKRWGDAKRSIERRLAVRASTRTATTAPDG